jgi:hypothetical protein
MPEDQQNSGENTQQSTENQGQQATPAEPIYIPIDIDTSINAYMQKGETNSSKFETKAPGKGEQ